jgi:molybdopterin/thiamine biosynthesis adenylyltransferase
MLITFPDYFTAYFIG